jgi:hypothetical protein
MLSVSLLELSEATGKEISVMAQNCLEAEVLWQWVPGGLPGGMPAKAPRAGGVD